MRTASSTAEARARVAERIPNVVVSDIAMPEEDGYGLLAWIRGLADERARGMPALAMTAYAQPGDRVRAQAAGFDEHLAKPFDPHVLVRCVFRLVRR